MPLENNGYSGIGNGISHGKVFPQLRMGFFIIINFFFFNKINLR